MAVHEKKESFKEHNDRGSILLAFYFVLTLLIPNLVLLYTEPYSIWSAEASLFIPMGFYPVSYTHLTLPTTPYV